MFLLFFLFFYFVNSTYSPNTCNITDYKFTFIFDKKDNRYKVHGLWPEHCEECLDCGYPSCCNVNNIFYTYPNDTYKFIDYNWYNSTTNEECTGKKNVILFEHEYYKHISCTDITNTNDFLYLVSNLYNKYYDDYVNKKCGGTSQLYLSLDNDFNYVNTICLS
jgi:ribonuclease I